MNVCIDSELTEMEEYVNGLNNLLTALSNCIQDMMAYQNVLDTYKFKTDPDNGLLMWQVSLYTTGQLYLYLFV